MINHIIIDAGKNTLKTLLLTENGIHENQFISKSKKVLNFSEQHGERGQYQTIYDGKKYLVGSVNSSFDVNPTKNNINTYIKIITGIGYWIKQYHLADTPFKLAIGMPTSDYNNDKMKQEFESEILSFKKKTFTVDGIAFTPKIKELQLLPEGMGLATRVFNSDKYKGKKLLVIDIGGYNINLCVYDANKNVLHAKSLDSVGCNQIVQNVKTELRKVITADSVNIDAIDITECISNYNFEKIRDYLSISKEDEKDLLDITVTQFLEEGLFSTSAEYSLDRISDQVLLLTGGGAAMLAPYFKELFKENAAKNALTISLNPVWENAFSYLMKSVITELNGNNTLIKKICDAFTNVNYLDMQGGAKEKREFSK